MVEGEATGRVIDSERSRPERPPETGSTDQYQPELGTEKRRSPRSTVPVSTPCSVAPTEPIRLNRCADSRLMKARSLAWRYSVLMIVEVTTSVTIAQIVDSATILTESERGSSAGRPSGVRRN